MLWAELASVTEAMVAACHFQGHHCGEGSGAERESQR